MPFLGDHVDSFLATQILQVHQIGRNHCDGSTLTCPTMDKHWWMSSCKSIQCIHSTNELGQIIAGPILHRNDFQLLNSQLLSGIADEHPNQAQNRCDTLLFEKLCIPGITPVTYRN